MKHILYVNILGRTIIAFQMTGAKDDFSDGKTQEYRNKNLPVQ